MTKTQVRIELFGFKFTVSSCSLHYADRPVVVDVLHPVGALFYLGILVIYLTRLMLMLAKQLSIVKLLPRWSMTGVVCSSFGKYFKYLSFRDHDQGEATARVCNCEAWSLLDCFRESLYVVAFKEACVRTNEFERRESRTALCVTKSKVIASGSEIKVAS